MIFPPSPWRMNCLATAWLRKKTALRFRLITASQSHSGVVDQNIDPAHRRHRLVDQTAHIIILAEIRLNGVKAAAQRQHLGGRIMGNFTVDADDIAPGLRQAQRHSLSQAGIATGHDGDLTRQVEGVQYHIHLCQLIYWRTMTPPVTSIEGGKQNYN